MLKQRTWGGRDCQEKRWSKKLDEEISRKKAEAEEEEIARKKAEAEKLEEEEIAKKTAEAKRLDEEISRKKAEAQRLEEEEIARKKAEAKRLENEENAKKLDRPGEGPPDRTVELAGLQALMAGQETSRSSRSRSSCASTRCWNQLEYAQKRRYEAQASLWRKCRRWKQFSPHGRALARKQGGHAGGQLGAWVVEHPFWEKKPFTKI